MPSRRSAVIAGLLLAVATNVAAVAQQAMGDAIAVSSPWARATPGAAKVGAAYFEISAPKVADKLVSAKSPAAGVVELHAHEHQDGVMKMRRVDGIPVEPGKTVTLQPGGLHVMLIDLKQPLKEGETIELTLVFEKAGEVPVKVPVLKVGSPGPGGKASGGGHGGHGRH